MNPARQFCSGGIVFKKGGGVVKVILISRQGGRVWCLPKGHIDAGESTEEAALREVREEAGVEAGITGKAGEIRYQFLPEGSRRKTIKKVTFFLMKYRRGSTKDHDFEVDEARWFSIGEAMRKISYPSERKLMQKARRLVR